MKRDKEMKEAKIQKDQQKKDLSDKKSKNSDDNQEDFDDSENELDQQIPDIVLSKMKSKEKSSASEAPVVDGPQSESNADEIKKFIEQ